MLAFLGCVSELASELAVCSASDPASMGAAASAPQKVADDGDASVMKPAERGQPARFEVTPLTAALKAKGSTLVLEVDIIGFRLLKPKTLDALNAFSWGEVHSWLHSPGRFSFRFYEERSQKIVEYDFKLQHVAELLANMEVFIEAVMSQRKAQAISDGDFDGLLTQLRQSPDAEKAPRIATAAQSCFFTSFQGATLMGTVNNTFDKVEIAVALHNRLIDQTEFATLLCCLECAEDRDNVWHRILASRAHKQPVASFTT